MKMTIKILNINWSLLIFALAIIGCNKEANEALIKDTGLCLVEIDGNFEEIDLDVAPEYLNGGSEQLSLDFLEEIIYPAEARENGVEGTCIIHYEITEQGTVENINSIQDPGRGIGASTINAIESVTQGVSFSPGILNDNPVRVKKEFEVRFKLE